MIRTQKKNQPLLVNYYAQHSESAKIMDKQSQIESQKKKLNQLDPITTVNWSKGGHHHARSQSKNSLILLNVGKCEGPNLNLF